MEELKNTEVRVQEQLETADTKTEITAETAAAIGEKALTEVCKKKTIEIFETFNNPKYVIGNAKKIMDGKYGGAFYVNYLQDTGSKTGHLQLIIIYPDGQIKRVYLAKNCFQTLQEECDGIVQIEVNGKAVTPKRRESLCSGDFRILEKYETPNMPIPSKVLWKAIVDNYEKIPVQLIYQSEDFEGMYWGLYEMAKETHQRDILSKRINDVRFLVTKEELEKVAIENGWTFSQLRTELDLRGLLIKDKSYKRDGNIIVNSYQLTIKVCGKNEKFYAIRMLLDVTCEEKDTSCLLEYTEDVYETETEKELRELRAANDSLKSKIAEKEKEIGILYRDRVTDATYDEIAKHLL